MAKGKKTGGRQKGSTNIVTATAREAFVRAFNDIGGANRMSEWAQANQTEFYKLYARLIPVEHVGAGGEGPISTIVKHVYEDTGAKA